MASSNYSANRYSSILKNDFNSKECDDVNAKKWDLNQIRMNHSLNAFMKNMQRPLDKSPLKDANLDITNIDEEEPVYSPKLHKVSFTNPDEPVNPDSTTAEFKKYLDDLKKNYLEKLTFSCPSKSTESRAMHMNKNNSHMKSVQNIYNKPDSRKSLIGNLNTRRSLYFDNIMENVEEEKPVQKSSFTTFKSDSLSKEESDSENVENILESPELTKSQILSRLVQIREYLKQSYTMLSTLQESNDLINYATQMNKLHLLIDHLKDQEKGYMDLLKSFSKFQNLTSNLYELETKINDPSTTPSNTNTNQFQKDILDLSELNDSVGNQQKEQKQQHTDIIVNHANYLNDIIKNSASLSSICPPSASERLTRSQSNNKSIAVQASIPTDFSFQRNNNEETDETSCANSISGSYISDTVTLNGINCNNLLKFKTMDTKPSDIENLMIVGKGYSNTDINIEIDEIDNKTENDLDLEEDQTEYKYDFNSDELFGNLPSKETDVEEQRKEIFNALDNDLATLEQLKEQKSILKTIRLRKEELKALEGRRLALEALRKIAGDSEMELDRAYADRPNKMKTSNSFGAFENVESAANQASYEKPIMNSFIENAREENEDDDKVKQVSSLVKFLDMLKEKQLERKMNSNDDETEERDEALTNSSIKKHQQLSRKTFKHPETDKSGFEEYVGNQNELIDENIARIEPSSQIEKSKKTVKHFEELIRNKKIANEDFASNLLKPIENLKSAGENVPTEVIDEEINLNESLNEELSYKMKDLAENEKKLEELYTMQSRLAQLKELISDYDGVKPLDEDSNMSIEKQTSNAVDYEQSKDMQQNVYRETLSKINQNKSEISNFGNQIQYDELIESEKEMKLQNKEDMNDQKIKLANAKEKLKQLQGIIANLKNVSTKSELSPKEQSELEQKEAAAALKILNEIEKQKQQQRLEDLKRNKQKLLELLKEKENESAELAKLYTSYSESKSEGIEPTNEKQTQLELDYNIENKFESAENDFEILSNMASPSKTYQHNSPSDVLWSQMKKQLNMREDLRNKKQELEDLIRDENRSTTNKSSIATSQRSSSNTSSVTENQETQANEENNEDNKIINCYRDFLLKNTNNFSSAKNKQETDNSEKDGSSVSSSSSEEEVEDEDEEEIIMKRYIPNINPKVTNTNEKSFQRKHDSTYTFKPHQQQNICSTDELIEENSQKFGKTFDLIENRESKEVGSDDEIFSNYKSNENKFTRDILSNHNLNKVANSESKTELKVFNELSMKFSDLVSNQQKMNESMQKNFTELVNFQKASINKGNQFNTNPIFDVNSQSNINNQFQFQFQMQMQQMMFSINSIHTEVNTQKTDMSQLKDQFKSVNDKLTEFVKVKTNNRNKPKLTRFTPPNVNITEKDENKSSSIITKNALPSYFYNRRQENIENQIGEMNLDKFTKEFYKSSLYQKTDDYTDDFEECDEDDEEDENDKENDKENDSTLLEERTKSTAKGYKNSYQAKNYQIDRSSSSSRSTNHSMKRFSAHTNSSNKFAKYDRREELSTCSNSDFDGEIFSFDQMREKIYSEVANLISQNETRPFYLINLFKELQYLKEKNARDQVLKSIFNIANRQTFKVEKKEIHHESNQSSMNSETSSSESHSKSENQNQKYEDDDSVTCKYRMKKFNSINRSSKSLKNPRRSTTTDSNFEQDNTRESSTCSQSPFENDSLSNTVIFVKNGQKLVPMPNATQASPKRNDEFSRSSSSSILGIQDTNCMKNKKPKAMEEFFMDVTEQNQKSSDQKVIELEVKNLISKIIKMIKISGDAEGESDSDSYDSDDEILDDLESLSSKSSLSSKPNDASIDYKHARCDSDYLNEIIEKVVLVLSQSAEHFDYLKLYKGQLNAYLKEALTKYENKRLIKCMEDILIDISDILYNELTFYSIMKQNNCIDKGQESIKRFQMPKLNPITELNTEKPGVNLVKSLTSRVTANLDEKKNIIDNKLQQLKHEYEILKNQSTKNVEKDHKKLAVLTSESSNATSRSTSASSVSSETQNSNTEVYYFDDNAIKTKLNYTNELPNSHIESNYSDILGKLKLILNEKTNELNSMMKLSKALKDAKAEESYNLKSEFTAIDSQDDEVTFHSPKEKDDSEVNEFKLKLLKYSKETVEKNEENTDETDTDAYTDADSESELPTKLNKKTGIIHLKENKVQTNQSDEIIIDDLPAQMHLALKQMEASTAEMNIGTEILDKIIMQSISDDFAGDSDALPSLVMPVEFKDHKEISDEENEKEQKSETSNSSSDNFVMLSSGSSDQVLIDDPVERDPSETLYLSADQSLTDPTANEANEAIVEGNQTINEEIFV